MTIYEQLTIAGSVVPSVNNVKVIKSTSENNASSSFTANINNYIGNYSDSYTIGDDVEVFADVDINPPTTKIFSGILENTNFNGKENRETLTLTGKDYTTRLIDRTVEPEVYNTLPAGSIVKDIISKYTDDITVNNVQDTTTTVSRIVFNQLPVFDAVRELAEQSNSVFYVDNDNDLHFEAKSQTSSGKTFDKTNVLSSKIKEQRKTVFNEIWVYGDRYLDGFEETFTGTGSTSDYNLIYKPHNTDIRIDDAIQKGAIANMMTENTVSGVDYTVNYEDKLITFQSGTEIGYNGVPGSNAAITMVYKRDLPIVKVGKDNDSITAYGKRIKVIKDENIKDPVSAEEILAVALAENSTPSKGGSIKVKGIVDVTPSNTCVVNIPFHNIDNQTYDIIEASYDFTPINNRKEDVLTVKVNKKIGDVNDTLKKILLDIKKLQGKDISDSDTLTRFEFTTGSVGIRQSGCLVYERSIAGDTAVWNSTNFGIWGTSKWGAVIDSTFILGNPQAGVLGINKLGDDVSAWELVWSGCYP